MKPCSYHIFTCTLNVAYDGCPPGIIYSSSKEQTKCILYFHYPINLIVGICQFALITVVASFFSSMHFLDILIIFVLYANQFIVSGKPHSQKEALLFHCLVTFLCYQVFQINTPFP